MEEQGLQSYHYAFVGSRTFKGLIEQLDEHLPYYRFSKDKDKSTKEIFYDGPNDVLSEAGIVLSKRIEDNKASLTLRKLSGGQSRKFPLGECALDEEPSDYSFKIASVIVKAFNSTLSIDLDSLIKQTMPKMEVIVDAEIYQIICGTGFRGSLQHERAVYKDYKTNKKVENTGVTFQFPTENCPETHEILEAIDRYVKGLSLLQLTRFELGCRLLYPPENHASIDLKDDDEEDEGDDEE